MIITMRVTPRRDGTIVWKGKEVGVVRRPKEPLDPSGRRKRAWECLQKIGNVELFIQQCDTQREGVLRLLLLEGALS